MSKNKKDRQAEEKAMESWHAHDTDQIGVSHTEMKLVSRTKPVDKSMMLKGTDADPLTTSGKWTRFARKVSTMNTTKPGWTTISFSRSAAIP